MRYNQAHQLASSRSWAKPGIPADYLKRLMELYIIRHGQSQNNAIGNDTNRTMDPLLTELGKQQAEKLSEYLVSQSPRYQVQCREWVCRWK